jgi:hypothetical protein
MSMHVTKMIIAHRVAEVVNLYGGPPPAWGG